MALLHLLARLAPELKVSIGVAHLNHCLRGAAADQDAEIVRMTATSMGCPCHVGRARVSNVKKGLRISLEDAGRRIRYAFFNKIMREVGYTKLALGHHMDDNAEQVLMALLRGTGPLGLAGISPIRKTRIVRPMIKVRRSMIESYVKIHRIAYVQDASNADQRYTRNRIRQHLLPMLASQYNPRIAEQLNQLADVMRTEEAWVDGMVTEHFRQAVIGRETNAITLSIDNLRNSHHALARRLIRKALQELTGSLQRIGFMHIDGLLSLLTKSSGEKEAHLPGSIRARCRGGHLVLSVTANCRRQARDKEICQSPPAETVINAPFPDCVDIVQLGIGLRFSRCAPRDLPPWADVGPERAFVDLDRVNPPLTVRMAVPGDRFAPLGCTGSQKLKKFFIDHGLPRQVRAAIPVLADTRKIVWLVGQRIDDSVKVTSTTSHVLGIEFFLLDTR